MPEYRAEWPFQWMFDPCMAGSFVPSQLQAAENYAIMLSWQKNCADPHRRYTDWVGCPTGLRLDACSPIIQTMTMKMGDLARGYYPDAEVVEIAGPPGPAGPAGPIGATGTTGTQGLVGPSGPQGIQGIQGLLGLLGRIGPIGPVGLRGSMGFMGPAGPSGSIPEAGQEGWAGFLQTLAAQLGRFFQRRTSLPQSGPTITQQTIIQQAPTTLVDGVPMVTVEPGATIGAPIIQGSTADVSGTIRPALPIGPRQRTVIPPPDDASTAAKLARLGVFFLDLFNQERHRKFLRDQARRARDIQLSTERTWRNFLSAFLGGREMGYGQSGLVSMQGQTLPWLPAGGGGGGGGWMGGLTDLVTAFGPVAQGIWGQPPATMPAMAPTGIGERLEQLMLEGPRGGGSSIPQLFKQTASGKMRARRRVQLLGPDGNVHTWLHAVPKGWKVNETNVSGRRKAHHHHARTARRGCPR